MFVPRFPGIPEMIYFPTPKAEGNITSQGFMGTEVQMFWYVSREAKLHYTRENESTVSRTNSTNT